MADVPLKIPACNSSPLQLQQHKDNVVMSAALQNPFIWGKKSPVRLIRELAVLQKCSSQMLNADMTQINFQIRKLIFLVCNTSLCERILALIRICLVALGRETEGF